MQSNLEVWEEQLKELYEKKKENGEAKWMHPKVVLS